MYCDWHTNEIILQYWKTKQQKGQNNTCATVLIISQSWNNPNKEHCCWKHKKENYPVTSNIQRKTWMGRPVAVCTLSACPAAHGTGNSWKVEQDKKKFTCNPFESTNFQLCPKFTATTDKQFTTSVCMGSPSSIFLKNNKCKTNILSFLSPHSICILFTFGWAAIWQETHKYTMFPSLHRRCVLAFFCVVLSALIRSLRASWGPIRC